MQIRPSVPSATILADLTTENGGIVVDGPNGKFTITIAASATTLYTWSTGVYDLEIVSGTGIVKRLLKGTVTVDPEVTR
jgi:hypothetical protein